MAANKRIMPLNKFNCDTTSSRTIFRRYTSMKLSCLFTLIFCINSVIAAEYRVSEIFGVHSILNQEHTFIGFLYEPSISALNDEKNQKVITPLFLYANAEALSKPGNSNQRIFVDVLTEYCTQKDCNSLANQNVKITGTIKKLNNWYSKSHALTDITRIEVLEDDDV